MALTCGANQIAPKSRTASAVTTRATYRGGLVRLVETQLESSMKTPNLFPPLAYPKFLEQDRPGQTPQLQPRPARLGISSAPCRNASIEEPSVSSAPRPASGRRGGICWP